MLDHVGVESARRVAEKAVRAVSISNEEDKMNLWTAYINLENNFGSQSTLTQVVKRALEVNDRKKVYLQLVNIYRNSGKHDACEEIYNVLCKKYHSSFKVWSGYLEFLFEVGRPAKPVLQRALQALQKKKHVNLICKFG